MDERMFRELSCLEPGTIFLNLEDGYREPEHYITLLDRQKDGGFVFSIASPHLTVIRSPRGPFYVSTDDRVLHPFVDKEDEEFFPIRIDSRFLLEIPEGLKMAQIYARLVDIENHSAQDKDGEAENDNCADLQLFEHQHLVGGLLRSDRLNDVECARAILAVLEQVPLDIQDKVLAEAIACGRVTEDAAEETGEHEISVSRAFERHRGILLHRWRPRRVELRRCPVNKCSRHAGPASE